MSVSDDPRALFEQFIAATFANEDDILRSALAEAEKHEMPKISVDAADGRLLQWLMLSVGAHKVVEIGALAGYSGIWMARALPDDGKLYTVEVSSKHAQVARASFERAGLDGKVELVQGEARVMLDKLRDKGPFDFVFIDADKESYGAYLNWAVDNLRSGGIVAAHNAYRHGGVVDPQNDGDRAMRDFLEQLATDDRLDSMVIPLGDGMAVGLRK
jgi:caffeoyl-CoA O-methyltransferase